MADNQDQKEKMEKLLSSEDAVRNLEFLTQSDDLIKILYFLRHEYGDNNGSISSEGMQKIRENFRIMQLINSRTSEAKSLIFKTFITTVTGAAMYAAYVGIKNNFFGS